MGIRLLILLQLSGNQLYDVPSTTADFRDLAAELQNPNEICAAALSPNATDYNSTNYTSADYQTLPNPINAGDLYLARMKPHDYFTLTSILVLILFAIVGRLSAVLLFRCRVARER